MNLHEYQGKELLKSYGVKIQEGIVAHTAEEAVAAAHKLKELYNSGWCVVKAQVHAGGRGAIDGCVPHWRARLSAMLLVWRGSRQTHGSAYRLS